MSVLRLACLALLLLAPSLATAAEPVAEVTRFLSRLTDNQRKAAVLRFDSDARTSIRWTPGPRAGLRMKDLDKAGQRRTLDLLRVLLGKPGEWMVRTVIERERMLAVVENAPEYRDPELYYLAVFGTPGPGRWGVRFEGHHLSVNLTYEGDQAISGTPLFVGSNPDTATEPVETSTFLINIREAADKLLAALPPQLREQARGRGAPLDAVPEETIRLAYDVIVSYLAWMPADVGERYEQTMREQLRRTVFRHGGEGFSLEGDGLSYSFEQEAARGPHFHSLFRDARHDYGG